MLTRAIKRPNTRNIGDSGAGTPYDSMNGGGRYTSVASRTSSRQQNREEGKSADRMKGAGGAFGGGAP